MANIKINQAEWNALNAEQQTQIVGILRRTGLLTEKDNVVPDGTTPKAGILAEGVVQPEGFWCKLGCNAAEAAAVAACGLLSGPAAAVCIAAAHAGGEFCRSKCD